MSEDPAKSGASGGTGWLRVATAEAGYAGNVVADITRITRTACGRALVRQILASGHGVLIDKPAATDPPNASVRPQALRAATAPGVATGMTDASGRSVLGAGGGSDCIIAYDPRQWPNPIFPAAPPSDVLLFAMLHQALAQLCGTADLLRDAAVDAVATDAAAVVNYRQERDRG